MDKKKKLNPKDNKQANITIVKDLDVDALFNLTYNFDLLKGIITTILNNQEILKGQIEQEKEKNNQQNEIIESLKNEIISIKENYSLKEEFKKITTKINQIDEYIIKIDGKPKSKNYNLF